VAAPVFRDGAVVVAALSVSAPASRLTPARLPEVAAACRHEAAGLSAALGHRPTDHGPTDHGPTDALRTPSTTKEGAA
jgi:hypothetical protein